jgi:hypothetical protein
VTKQNFQGRPHFGGDDLRTFGMQIAAKALKVCRQKQDVAAIVLVDQREVGW